MPNKQTLQSNDVDMFMYFKNMANRHYNSSFIRDKEDTRNQETYYKSWVNDMNNILIDYEIDVETFLNNLINLNK